jgi:membrane-bound lytic murein transglycosylase D
MGHRGKSLGLQINYWVDERRDPEKATRAAAKYLKELFILLNDWQLALLSYNRGEFGIIRDMKFSNASSVEEMKERSATPKETQNYVPQFIVATKIGENPQEYGFDNLQYECPLEYDIVIINKVIDLKVVAKCADTTVEIIRQLNPSILAWCTPHGYNNFELKIPSGTKDIFLENIAKEKELNPSPGFIKHKIKKGEWLELIAQKYRTSVKEIKNDNPKLKKQKYIYSGQIIVIRPGRKYFDCK